MTTRACKKCKEVKAIEDFPLYDKAKGHRRHECGICDKKRIADAHARTKDRRLQKARDRYKANPIKYWPPERRARAKDLDRERYLRIRNAVFDRHGSECVACGETERLFLTIDHINNDGWALRKSEGGYRESGIGLYLDILRYGLREDLECLCFNCNFGKRRNGGILVRDRRIKGKRNDQSGSS